MKKIVVGQSGGPTAVINSSLLGVYTKAKELGIEKVYGMVHGIASCNETYGTFATVYSGNQNNISQGYSGRECWCRMTSPVRSAWVFLNTRTSTSECVSACARFCGMGFRDGATFRAGFFTTAGN